MCQVVGQTKVELDQFGSKVYSTLKIVQNEENRLTSVILDKNNAKYNFYGSCERSSTCKYIYQRGQRLKLNGMIMIKGVK